MKKKQTQTIYNFTFVDRDKERKRLIDFMNNPQEHILVMRGSHGVGKTELINNFLNNYEDSEYIYIEKCEGENTNYLSILLDEIERKRPKYLQDYLKKGGKILIQLLTDIQISIDEFSIPIFIDQFFSKKVSDNEKVNFIKDFLVDMYNTGLKVIILDNFVYCEDNVKALFSEIIYSISSTQKIKIIIIDLDDTKVDKQNIDYYLDSFQPFLLTNIDEQIHFNTIFDSIKTDRPVPKEIVNEVFKYCKGNLYSLIELLRYSIYDNNSSDILSVDSLTKILHERIHLNSQNQSIDHLLDIDSFIVLILILLWFHRPLPKILLKDIYNKLIKNIFQCYYVDNFEKIFKELEINEYIIDKDFTDTYYFKYDNDVIYIKKYIKNKSFYKTHFRFIAQYLIVYLNDNRSALLDNFRFSDNDVDEIKIECMFYSKHVELINECLRLGMKYYNEKNYYKASKLFKNFLREKNTYKLITDKEILLKIGFSYYLSGDYVSAEEILDIFELENTDYYFLKAKVYNILLNKEKALNQLQKIEKMNISYDTLCKINNMKIIILLGKSDNESRNILYNLFFHEYNILKNKKLENIYEAIILTNSFNFLSHFEAKKNMEKALEYLNQQIKNEDITFYKGMTYHNLGAIIARQEGLSEAKKMFLKAEKLLKSNRTHELSYTYNNLAYIELLNDNYLIALEYISKALIYNTSKYAFLAIRCNQLISYCQLKEFQNAKIIADEFENIILTNNYEDNTILRKLVMNLAFYYSCLNNIETVKKFLIKYECIIQNTNSSVRFNKFIDKYDFNLEKQNEKTHPNDVSCLKEYEAWCITINHD